jgi:hypothetical protein
MMFDTVHLLNSQDMLQEHRGHCQRQRESAVSLGEKLIDELVLLEIPEQFKSVCAEYLTCFDVQKRRFNNFGSVLLETREMEHLLELSNTIARLHRVKDLIDRYNSVSGEAKMNLLEIPSLLCRTSIIFSMHWRFR